MRQAPLSVQIPSVRSKAIIGNHEQGDIMNKRETNRRKVLAILAGGAVLGVGAALTLAAWNDSEFARGEFGAGTFVFQGSTNGSTWNDHATTETAATLSFQVGADNLAPGDDVYAAYALRVTGDYDATLESVAPVISGDLTAAKLAVAARAIDDMTCDADAFATGESVPTAIEADEIVYLCLQVEATSQIEQGDEGAVVWQWNAESTTD